MISYSNIQGYFYTLFTTVTGVQVIWAEQNAPRPANPYISLKLLNSNAIGYDYITEPDDDGMAVIYGNREFTLEINYFGNDGLGAMEQIRTAFFNPVIREELNQIGLVFVERLTFLDTTQLLDTRYERRYTMELRFRYSNQGVGEPDKIDIGLIETAEITKKIKDQAGDVVLEHTYIVPVGSN